METETDIKKFLVEYRAWGQETKNRYERTIKLLIADIADLKNMDATRLNEWLTREEWGSSYRWVNFCAIKNYLRWKYGDSHPALKLKIKRYESGPQRCLEIEQVTDLLASFNTATPFGVRNLAICCLFLDTGLRVSEICRLQLSKIDLQRRKLTVIIKGGDVGAAVFTELTAHYISWWLPIRSTYAKPETKELFIGIAGTTPGKKMTRSGISCLMRKWIKSIPSISALSPHDLRRTFATIATENGAPERVVAVAGRWESTTMVKRYTESLKQREILRYSPVEAALNESHATQ